MLTEYKKYLHRIKYKLFYNKYNFIPNKLMLLYNIIFIFFVLFFVCYYFWEQSSFYTHSYINRGEGIQEGKEFTLKKEFLGELQTYNLVIEKIDTEIICPLEFIIYYSLEDFEGKVLFSSEHYQYYNENRNDTCICIHLQNINVILKKQFIMNRKYNLKIKIKAFDFDTKQQIKFRSSFFYNLSSKYKKTFDYK